MKIHLLLLSLFPCLLTAQDWDAAQRFNGSIAGMSVTSSAIAAGPGGATYIAGSLEGTAQFDTITVTGQNPGATYGYLLKMNQEFRAEWVRVFPQTTYDVTVDLQGNIFVAGSQNDSLSWVAKYHSNGQLLASFTSQGGNSHVRVVRTDAAGNCYIGGWMNAATSFGGLTPAGVGGREAFIARLSPDLSQVHWANLTGASNRLDEIYDLEVDNNGFIYTSGNYRQTFNLFCGCYNGSFFLEKHNAATGSSVWQKLFSGGSGTSTRQLVSLSPDGQTIYTSGSFKNTTTIDPGLSLTAAGNDDYHIFLVSLTAAGSVNWAKKIVLTGDIYPTGMVRLDEQLVLHGYFRSPALLETILLTPQGIGDAFLAKVTGAGSIAAAEAFTGTGPGTEFGYGLDARSGDLVVSGNTSSGALQIGSFNLSGLALSQAAYAACSRISVPLSAQILSLVHPDCPGAATGVVAAAALGGTAPYSFLWSTGDTTATVIGLVAGDYTVTVEDDAGASYTLELTLNDPPVLTLQASLEHVSCSGAADGSISIEASGGTGAYVYEWNNGGQTNVITGLAAGSYTLTVTDENGCTSAYSKEITEPQSLEISIAGVQNAACGQNNGQASVTVTGGTSPYGYAWSNLATGPEAGNLTAGNYTVTATDANGCSSSVLVTIQDTGNTLEVALNVLQSPACDNTADGQLSAAVTGGTMPYTYAWSNNQTGPTATGLAPGQHSLTVTDVMGCSMVQNITLEGQTMLLVSMNISAQNLCSGDSQAAVSASPMNGMPPYTYVWNTGDTTAGLTGLPAGSYFVTIMDAGGCSTVAGALFQDPLPLTIQLETVDPACQGQNTGQISVQAAGGTAPYTFLWDNGKTTASLSGLAPGNYTVTLTDINGCTRVSSASVGDAGLVIDPGIETNQAGLTALQSGAQYQWIDCQTGLDIPGATGQTFEPGTGGEYAVEITLESCTATSDCVLFDLVAAEDPLDEARLARVFPNPSDGRFTLHLPWEARVWILEAGGKLLVQTGYAAGQHEMDFSTWPKGVYLMRIGLDKGVQTIRFVKQ